MRILESMIVFAFALLTAQASAAQDLDDYSLVEIRNVGTGLYIDVSFSQFREGQNVWTYTGNTSDAQYFRIIDVRDGNIGRIGTYVRRDGGPFYLTYTDIPRDIVITDPQDTFHRVRLQRYLDDGTIDPMFSSGIREDGLATSVLAQEWRFEPVSGERFTYVIRNLSRENRVLTARDSEDGAALYLLPFENDPSQHWVLEPQWVSPPENVQLERLWYTAYGRIRGEISWRTSGFAADHFRVYAYNDAFPVQRSPDIPPGQRSWFIEFEPGTEAEGKTWCFHVESVNRRTGTDYTASSPAACGIANRLSPENKGYSQLVITNCHNSRDNARIWISLDGGVWQDKGLAPSLYRDGGCPGNRQPVQVELDEGKVARVNLISTSCGNGSPLEEQASCRMVLETSVLGGDSSAPPFHFYLN